MLETLEGRKAIINEIKGEENKSRKRLAWAQSEIFRDRQHQYVLNYLRSKRISEETLQEMPIWSSINLTRRIVKQEASIYRNDVTRTMLNMTDVQQDAINALYDAMYFNQKMQRLNEAYKLHDQAFMMIVPKDSKLVARVLAPYQLDVVPMPDDPEQPMAYIVSSYDRTYEQMRSDTDPKSRMLSGMAPYADQVNQKIGDADDYKASLERYVVWTNDLNFIMNGNGELVGEALPNPIGRLPFIEVSQPKDFEFWVRSGSAISDFSIQLNAALSDVGQVVRMQGWGQAYLISEKDTMPEHLLVGPNYVIRLPVNPQTNVRPEFGFAQSNADIDGSIKFVSTLLSMFLSSRGINPKSVSAAGETEKYNSGLDRLLALVEKFEATKSDYERFLDAEHDAFDIIARWHSQATQTDTLAQRFWAPQLSSDASIAVRFEPPSMTQSETEKLDLITRKLEQGLITRAEAVAIDRGITVKEAKELLEQIDAELLGERFAKDE